MPMPIVRVGAAASMGRACYPAAVSWCSGSCCSGEDSGLVELVRDRDGRCRVSVGVSMDEDRGRRR